jgi:TusA-related sulfurtransferase
MPIVKISRAMKELQVGDELRVEASDPSFQSDIEAWVRKMGHELKSFEESQGIQIVVLEKQS